MTLSTNFLPNNYCTTSLSTKQNATYVCDSPIVIWTAMVPDTASFALNALWISVNLRCRVLSRHLQSRKWVRTRFESALVSNTQVTGRMHEPYNLINTKTLQWSFLKRNFNYLRKCKYFFVRYIQRLFKSVLNYLLVCNLCWLLSPLSIYSRKFYFSLSSHFNLISFITSLFEENAYSSIRDVVNEFTSSHPRILSS